MKILTIAKFSLAAAEAFMLAVFILPITRGILNAGNAFGILLCTAALACTIGWGKLRSLPLWHTKAGKIILCCIAVLIVVAVTYAVFLSVMMANAYDSRPEKPNVVVVLGCGVKGTRPTQMLTYRLDAAYEYLTENDGVMCVVSGGQGKGEDISEAEAMKRYLIEKGLPEERIITEDRSTSTEENLSYTAEILKEMGLPLDITIVSDGYHQYRASLIARDCGYENVYSISGFTRLYLLPTYWLREWLALTAYYIIG